MADVTGEHFWDAELHRLTGTVLLAENKLDEGGASLQHAIHIAQAQQAKSLELRATASFAHLWRDQGKFDTRDLKEVWERCLMNWPDAAPYFVKDVYS